jgi:hypothetical protein
MQESPGPQAGSQASAMQSPSRQYSPSSQSTPAQGSGWQTPMPKRFTTQSSSAAQPRVKQSRHKPSWQIAPLLQVTLSHRSRQPACGGSQ